jgi:hypothetical protein
MDKSAEKEVKEIDYIEELNNELKELESIKELYIRDFHREEFDERILKDVKIPVEQNGQECGKVDIGEYISIYLDDIKYHGKPERVFFRKRGPHGTNDPFAGPKMLPINIDRDKGEPGEMVEAKLSEVELEKIAKFEKLHIKSSGPSDTVIGELFRAFQRIEYRAGNDGDNYCCIGTPSFISYLFINSTIDIINWSWLYEKEFKLENPILGCWTHGNQIGWDGMLFEIKFIQLVLIELLEAGVIEDRPNEIDSRDFTKIKKENERWY